MECNGTNKRIKWKGEIKESCAAIKSIERRWKEKKKEGSERIKW